MTKLLSSLVCAAVLATSCGANPNSPAVSYPVSLTLQAGQTQSAGGLSVKFIGVTSDSRCPAAAICITSGDAYLQFALSTNAQAKTQELQVEHPDNRRTSYDGYTIEVAGLAPYPITFNSIKPEDYRVSVTVNR